MLLDRDILSDRYSSAKIITIFLSIHFQRRTNKPLRGLVALLYHKIIQTATNNITAPNRTLKKALYNGHCYNLRVGRRTPCEQGETALTASQGGTQQIFDLTKQTLQTQNFR